jgi:hypothetical protein
LDVIVSDAAKAPIVYNSVHNRVIQVECVYAVIEVKADLDTAELEKTVENMISVKSLVKRAYGPEVDVIRKTAALYGQQWSIWPVNYFVFAYESIDLASIRNKLEEIHNMRAMPVHQRVDSLCVLDKGVICNVYTDGPNAGKLDALPAPNTVLTVVPAKRALLFFYTIWSRYFNSAWLPLFEFQPYLGRINFNGD